MDQEANKSCWGVTVWAVVGFACLLTIVYLAGGDTGVAIASAGN